MVTKPKFVIDDMKLLEELGEQHLTKEDIAIYLGCSHETLNQRQNENPAIAEAIKRGRVKGKVKNIKQIYKLVEQGNVAAILFMAKCKYGFSETVNLANADEKPLKLQIEYLNGNGEAQSD